MLKQPKNNNSAIKLFAGAIICLILVLLLVWSVIINANVARASSDDTAGGAQSCVVNTSTLFAQDSPSGNNGGSNGGGGGGGVGQGNCAFGSTNCNSSDSGSNAPQGQVLGAGTTCGPYISSYMRYGKKNNPDDVKKLQEFLNKEFPGANIPVTGFFGPITRSYVMKFQLKYSDEILKPWNGNGKPEDHNPTGYVYKTTLRKINNLMCSSLNLPLPSLF